MPSILKEKYTNEIRQSLQKELGIKNINATPKVNKIVISTGIGDYKEEKETIADIKKNIAEFTGQAPKINLSKKAVSAFKLRIGQPVGLTVTLRDEKMYDFISKLVNVAIPRIRDFKGLQNKSFDSKGNYVIGITDHSIMPEIKYENINKIFGFQINIQVSAKDKESSKALLKALGFPFERD